MGKYFEECSGVVRDELIGGVEYPVRLANVTVGGAVQRGQILAGVANGVYAKATASDLNKNFVIAAADTSDSAVTQAYISGVFNRERLDPSDTAIFELELRRQNIHLTGVK